MDAKDRRTKRQKLKDMANQSASPQEAEIAKKKLEELPPEDMTLKNGDGLSFTIKFETAPFNQQDFMDKMMDGVWILRGDKFEKL